jgi:hypothetical protein
MSLVLMLLLAVIAVVGVVAAIWITAGRVGDPSMASAPASGCLL